MLVIKYIMCIIQLLNQFKYVLCHIMVYETNLAAAQCAGAIPFL